MKTFEEYMKLPYKKERRGKHESVLCLLAISKHAFDSDVSVGAASAGGPPGYKSLTFYTKMARMNCLYKLLDADGMTVGGAVLFPKETELNIGIIFVAPKHFRKGYGMFMMQQI